MIRRRVLLGAALASPALAQPGWPQRSVRIVVPFPPGGSNDVIARPLADRLQARLGVPVVVENRGGAGGAIGAGVVAQAPPDGHTLLVTSSSFATSAVLQKTPWDAEASFECVALLARAPFFVMVNPAFPAGTLAELVALAKAKPLGIDYASSGTGGINHFITEGFCQAAGIRMNQIPYRGTGPAVIDLVAGTVPLLITTVASARAPLGERRLRVLAATGPGGGLPPEQPPVPTLKDLGIDFEVLIWWGLLAPRGLPPEVRASINAAANAALGDAGLRRVFDAEGAEPSPAPPEAMSALLRSDLARWRAVAVAANITAE